MPTGPIPCAAYWAMRLSTAGATTGDHVGVHTFAVGTGAGVSGTMIRGGAVACPPGRAGAVTACPTSGGRAAGDARDCSPWERESHHTAPALIAARRISKKRM